MIREKHLIGMISRNEIYAAATSDVKNKKRLSDICMKKVIKIYPDQSLFMALHLIDKFHVSRLPVVSRLDDTKIMGIITADDVVKKFGFHIKEQDSPISYQTS